MHSANDPFRPSGSELFQNAGSEGAIPSAHSDIFTKPKAGGGNGIGGGGNATRQNVTISKNEPARRGNACEANGVDAEEKIFNGRSESQLFPVNFA